VTVQTLRMRCSLAVGPVGFSRPERVGVPLAAVSFFFSTPCIEDVTQKGFGGGGGPPPANLAFLVLQCLHKNIPTPFPPTPFGASGPSERVGTKVQFFPCVPPASLPPSL